MSCETTREAILDGVPAQSLPHLQSCPSCRAFAESVRAGEADLERALDAFAAAGDFDAAFERATRSPPARRPPMFHHLRTGLIGTAIAATALLTLRSLLPAPPPGGSPPVQGATPEAIEAAVGADEEALAPHRVEASSPVSPDAPPTEWAMPLSTRLTTRIDPTDTDTDTEPDGVAAITDDGREDPAPEGTAGGSGASSTIASCGDPIELETTAILGRLEDRQIRCLEAVDAEWEKAQRLLAIHWFTAGERSRWVDTMEGLTARLRAERRVDPDLSYKLALHYSQQQRPDAVLLHANEALSAASKWTGDTWDARVYSLHKLITTSHLKLWEDAVRTGSGEAASHKARLAEAVEAWLAVAHQTGKSLKRPREVCELVLDDAERCR